VEAFQAAGNNLRRGNAPPSVVPNATSQNLSFRPGAEGFIFPNYPAKSRNLLLVCETLTAHRVIFCVSDNYAMMSDMASNRITVRIPETLTERLRSRSRAKGTSESDLVREALENYLGQSSQGRSAYELAEEAAIVGMVRRAAKDLSTNRRHFKGFGESR
jgi:predicted DNA-binding protein